MGTAADSEGRTEAIPRVNPLPQRTPRNAISGSPTRTTSRAGGVDTAPPPAARPEAPTTRTGTTRSGTRTATGSPSRRTAAGSTGAAPRGGAHRPADTGIGSFPDQSELVRETPPARIGALLVALAVGSLVSVGLGVYGRLHEPTLTGLSVAGFSSGLAAKAWLGSAAFALVLVQLLSAVLMYRTGAGWPAALHRWSGRVAVLVTVPVAVHCLYALGFQLGSPRVLAHSLAGCFVYGVFTAKMLVLPRPGLPRWGVPLLGGLLFTALTAVWVTSSLWYFGSSGLTF